MALSGWIGLGDCPGDPAQWAACEKCSAWASGTDVLITHQAARFQLENPHLVRDGCNPGVLGTSCFTDRSPRPFPAPAVTRCLLGLGLGCPSSGPISSSLRAPTPPDRDLGTETPPLRGEAQPRNAGTGGFPGRGLPSGSGPELPPSARVPRLLGDRSAPL